MFKLDKTSWLLSGAFLCFAPAAFADCPANAPSPSTACMNLVSAGSKVMANVYVGPYSAIINGAPTPTPVICDDFSDDSYINETWTADVSNGSGPYGSTWMSNRPIYGGQTLTQAYNEIGFLALQLLGASD